MPFDLYGARSEGYSDNDILSYLSGSRGIDAGILPGNDEEKIQLLMMLAGTPGKPKQMRPYEYAPSAESPRRDMTWGEINALQEQGHQGLQPNLLPNNLWDLAVNNPVSQWIGEAMGQ